MSYIMFIWASNLYISLHCNKGNKNKEIEEFQPSKLWWVFDMTCQKYKRNVHNSAIDILLGSFHLTFNILPYLTYLNKTRNGQFPGLI